MNVKNAPLTERRFISASLIHAMKRNFQQINVHKSLCLITPTAG